MQPSELRALNWDDSETLWVAITQIEAQQLLLQSTVAQYPWMTTDERRKLHREWHRKAYPMTYENAETLSTVELAERLRRAIDG